jgi:hypothetical protein
MNILSANTVSSKAKTGTVIGTFSHAGASGGQYILDAVAQVFFSVNASNQLAWSPVAGISITTGLSDQCVSDFLGVRHGRLPVHNPGHAVRKSRPAYH